MKMMGIRPQIILFGDSITQQSFAPNGWGSALADNFSRKADILNRGYGGYNTRWALFLLHHIFPLDLANPPAAATIFFGANDAALLGRNSERQHVPIEEFKENLRKIVLHLKVDVYGEKAMKIPERTNETAGEYANQCITSVEEVSIPSINLWSKMQENEGWQRKYLSDGLHLTSEGNAVVYKEVVRVFNQAGLSAPSMPYDFPHHSEIDSENPEKAFTIQCS